MAIDRTVDEAIAAIAKAGIKKGEEDGRSFEHLSIAELIAAKRDAASTSAAAKSHFGLRMTKLIPPTGG